MWRSTHPQVSRRGDHGQASAVHERSRLRRGRLGELGGCPGGQAGPVRREGDRARGRQERQPVPGQEARHDRADALGPGDQGEGGLGLLLDPAEAHPRPQDAGPAGQGGRRLELDQRHGLRARQPRQLRLLGGRGQHRLGRRLGERGVQAHGGLRGRRQRLSRRRRTDQDHAQQDAAGRHPAVHPGDLGRARRQGARRLQRRVAGGCQPDAAERCERTPLQRLARLHPPPRRAHPGAADRGARDQGRHRQRARHRCRGHRQGRHQAHRAGRQGGHPLRRLRRLGSAADALRHRPRPAPDRPRHRRRSRTSRSATTCTTTCSTRSPSTPPPRR